MNGVVRDIPAADRSSVTPRRFHVEHQISNKRSRRCNSLPARGNITPNMTPPTAPRKKLPIGIQTFAKIREDDAYYYVDKTALIRSLVEPGQSHLNFPPAAGVR